MPIDIVPSVSALPNPPRTENPTTFVSDTDTFLASLSSFQTQHNASITAFNAATGQFTSQATASLATMESRAAANLAAMDAKIAAAGFVGTSTTSVAVGAGAKSLTIQPNLAFAVGGFAMVAATASPTNWMFGQVTAYAPATGALTLNVTTIGGTGTFSAWTVSTSAPTDAALTTALATAQTDINAARAFALNAAALF